MIIWDNLFAMKRFDGQNHHPFGPRRNDEAEAGKPASKERPNQAARYSSGEDLVSASEFDWLVAAALMAIQPGFE
jgi:hypothetical protein